MGSKIITLFLFAIALMGCQPENNTPDRENEGLIGQKLEAIAGLSVNEKENANVVSMFDETTRRVHQFDLGSMKHLKSFKVKNPKDKHYLLYNGKGNYVIDMSDKHMSVYDKNGNGVHDPLNFLGVPKSAAFHHDLGYLVLYDNLNSVGILKINANGKISKKWLSGPLVEEDNKILAGDINDDGQLVLGMADSSIIVVNLEETLNQQEWVHALPVITTFEDIKWIAPIPNTSNQILLSARGKLALVNSDDGTILDEVTLDSATYIHKYSKSKDPHIFFMRGGNDVKLSLAYVKDGEIKLQTNFFGSAAVLNSVLDLKRDTWLTVNSDPKSSYTDDWDQTKIKRYSAGFQFSSMLATSYLRLPDKAQLKFARNYAFALFPSELGYAQRIELNGGKAKELKMFNAPYIR